MVKNTGYLFRDMKKNLESKYKFEGKIRIVLIGLTKFKWWINSHYNNCAFNTNKITRV